MRVTHEVAPILAASFGRSPGNVATPAKSTTGVSGEGNFTSALVLLALVTDCDPLLVALALAVRVTGGLSPLPQPRAVAANTIRLAKLERTLMLFHN